MKPNLYNVFETVSPHSHSVSLQNFMRSKGVANACLGLFEVLAFEKKLVLSAYKKQFGRLLPSAATLSFSSAYYNIQAPSGYQKKLNPTLLSKRGHTVSKAEFLKETGSFETSISDFLKNQQKNSGSRRHGKNNLKPRKNLTEFAIVSTPKQRLGLKKKGFGNPEVYSSLECKRHLWGKDLKRELKILQLKKNLFKTQAITSGVQCMAADWALEKLSQSLKRSGAKTILNRYIRDVKSFMDQWQSSCAIKGLRVTATGRLSKRKKGLAQQITLSVGKVPGSTLSERVDYSQGFIKTARGLIGLKLWLAFHS